jgi:hypothetical protein
LLGLGNPSSLCHSWGVTRLLKETDRILGGGLAVLVAVLVLASCASVKSNQSIAEDLQQRIDAAGGSPPG